MHPHCTTNDAPKLCECGCGLPLPRPKYPSKQRRFLRNHAHRGRPHPVRPLADRLWERVDRRGFDECWLWRGSVSHGYGNLGVRGVKVGAHRISWELHFGPIPDGMFVLHHCDNPRCVNPYHLFLGTQTDNMVDMHSKGRNFVNGPQRARGERSGTAKLTEEQVREIREYFAQGKTQIELARDYGIPRANIFRIVRRKTWRHI